MAAAVRPAPIASSSSSSAHWKRRTRCVRLAPNCLRRSKKEMPNSSRPCDARHERQLQNLTEEIRRMEFREADWQVQALQKSKQSAQAKRQYYADLIANGLIPKEQSYQNLMGVSMTTRAAGNIVEAVGQVMNLIPDNTTGVAGVASTPVSVFKMPIGTKLAHAFAAAARILYTVRRYHRHSK